MTLANRPRYAARLNAFKTKGRTVAEMIAGAGQVGGLSAADLNYPDHFAAHDPATLQGLLADQGLLLNGLAMRYYTEAGFKLGAFTHPDPATRRAAIDLTRRGIDACAAMGGSQMTLWMGQDGFDYSFQADYARMWDDTIAALAEVASTSPTNPAPTH
jgi:L-rhamnose isomerase